MMGSSVAYQECHILSRRWSVVHCTNQKTGGPPLGRPCWARPKGRQSLIYP